jgi:predicted HTH transcriptional regulator
MLMLEELISKGESTTLEFKRTIDSPVKIAKTLVAFANTRGGILLIGVADDGKITGITSELHEMEKLEHAASYLSEPSIAISYQSQKVAQHQVLIITIAESPAKPHYVKESPEKRTAYIRANNKSVPAGKGMTTVLNAGENLAPEKIQLLQSKNIKNLLAYLQKNESITANRYAKLINISSGRAAKILKDLTWHGILLLHDKQRPVTYSLK